MARGWSIAFAGVLAASVGLNAYFWLTRTPNAAVEPAAPRPRTSSLPRMEAPTVRPALAPTPRRTPASIPAEYERLDRTALEQRLADAEARLERTMPLSEKFARSSERSPESEARVRRYLGKAFGTNAPAFDVECHGQICKTSVNDRAVPGWEEEVQTTPEALGLFGGQQFVGGQHTTWYTTLVDPAIASTKQLMIEIVMAAHNLPAAITCQQSNPGDKGDMILHVALDSAARRFVVNADGPLAMTALGVCVRKALQDMLDSFAIPTEVTSLPDIPIPVSY